MVKIKNKSEWIAPIGILLIGVALMFAVISTIGFHAPGLNQALSWFIPFCSIAIVVGAIGLYLLIRIKIHNKK